MNINSETLRTAGRKPKPIFTLKEDGRCGGHLKKRAITLIIYVFIIEKVHPVEEYVESSE